MHCTEMELVKANSGKYITGGSIALELGLLNQLTMIHLKRLFQLF